jgi:hypothetical protein
MELAKVRYLQPKLVANVQFLCEKSGERVKITPHSAKDKDTLAMALHEHERKLVRKIGYNLILRNLPQVAEDETGKQVVVTYESVVKTLEKFGKVDNYKIISGTVYAQFKRVDDAKMMYKLVNNMQIGKNIVKLEVF